MSTAHAKHRQAVSTDRLSLKDELLAFRYSHFGDDSKPENWFVGAETALGLSFDAVEPDDGLGYYEDGTKRTLTDAQIAIFRHNEIEVLLRERRLDRDEKDYQTRPFDEAKEASPASDDSSIEGDLVGLGNPTSRSANRPSSKRLRPVDDSEASSIEGDLASLAQEPTDDMQQQPRDQEESLGSRQPLQQDRQPSQSSRSSASQLSGSQPPRGPKKKKKKRSNGVPYDQRHKRKWEKFITGEDEVEGSITHRRAVRELDNQQTERVVVDYGED